MLRLAAGFMAAGFMEAAGMADGVVVDGAAAGADRRLSVQELVWDLPVLPGESAVGGRVGETRVFAIARSGLVGAGELCL